MGGAIRQPIICVLGHVDAGKTTLLDKIRGSAVALREVGSMTQHIGASFFPLKTLQEICGPLLKRFKGEIMIPGLIVIDTPGHSAFVNLRTRGGSVADMAILVVDIIRGFEAQTHESVSMLKSRRTPFVVAANKIDMITGWVKHSDATLMESLRLQDRSVQRQLDDLIYTVMGTFSRLGLRADRFDRVGDFTTTVAIIPVSAKTGEGIPELLSVLVGLTQQYMQQKLRVASGPAKGVVLEVKEELGLGVTLNSIIYDGVLREGDIIVVGGKEKPIVTKVRAILLPKPLDEIRDPRDKFTPVEELSAAAGVKVVAPGLEEAVAGAPILAVAPGLPIEEAVRSVSEEVERVKITTDKVGVVLKADSLGSLEAIVDELENRSIPVRLADIGNISKRDILEASIVKASAPLYGVVLGFDVKVLPDAEEAAMAQRVPTFLNNVIYRLVEDYSSWMKSEQEARIKEQLETLIRPGKVKVMPGFIFRKSKPAIVGVEVLAGRIRPKYPMVNVDGKMLGEITQIQDKGQPTTEASVGMKVAVSMKEPMVGRQFDEGDILYVGVPENQMKELKTKYQRYLSPEDEQTLEELAQVMRKTKPLWGL